MRIYSLSNLTANKFNFTTFYASLSNKSLNISLENKMYPNKIYQKQGNNINDVAEILNFIDHFPFAILTSIENSLSVFAQVPLILKTTSHPASSELISHIDNLNPFLPHLNNKFIQAIFQGPNSYISPNDYVTNQLPTWNYSVAYANGRSTLITTKEEKVNTMIEILRKLEKSNGSTFNLDIKSPLITKLLEKITFFKMEISEVNAVFKYSQEKCDEDQSLAKKRLHEKVNQSNKLFLKKV